MSIGMQAGFNFINKGIDQFSYGVDQEYRRHERHRLRDYELENRASSRKWQIEDQNNAYSREFKQKMKMAKQYGIHPLVLTGGPGPGSSTITSSPRSAPPGTPPSGGGNPISGSRDSVANTELIKAQTRLINAQADQIGQSPVIKNVPAEISPSGNNKGIQVGVNPQMKYEKTPEGYFNLIARDNEAYSDEAPITTQAFFLWDDVARRKFGHTIKNNWSKKGLQYKKKLWISSRPSPSHKGNIVLWDEKRGQWQELPKTRENDGHIFKNTRTYKPRGRKQRPVNYQGLPMS